MKTIAIPVNDRIKQAFEQASPKTQQQLIDLIELFFQQEQGQEDVVEIMQQLSLQMAITQTIPENLQVQPRAGINSGTMIMASDFDECLPDEFWLQ